MGRLFAKFFPAALSTASFVQETPSGTVNGTNTAFTLSFTPSVAAGFKLTLNGLMLINGTDYTLSGTTITMTTAPTLGQTLLAEYLK